MKRELIEKRFKRLIAGIEKDFSHILNITNYNELNTIESIKLMHETIKKYIDFYYNHHRKLESIIIKAKRERMKYQFKIIRTEK